MQIEITLDQNNQDLLDYFSRVDEEARPYVLKQLARLSIQMGGNPFAKAVLNPVPLPDFEHKETVQVKPTKTYKAPVTKINSLSLEERKKNLEKKLKDF